MKERINAIDIVRGLIMIIMTLDHVRDFINNGPSPLNMHTTTVLLFFTRWITHFCAPTFIFLGGVSVFLAGQKKSKPELSTFLLKRGIWLILSDLLIISLIFTFDPTYHVLVLEVLAATGFGMVMLALLIRAPLPVILAVGLLIIGAHNLFDYIQIPKDTTAGLLTTVFFTAVGSIIPIGANREVAELYAFITWSGVMFLGYCFGSLYGTGFDAEKRKKILRRSGIAFVVLIIALRLFNHYGDQNPWTFQRNAAHTLLSFLNVSKQPPSLLYLSITLGPLMILLSFAEQFKDRFSAVCKVYGNVPYFYFIVHLCFIRILNMVLIVIQGLPIKFSGYPLGSHTAIG